MKKTSLIILLVVLSLSIGAKAVTFTTNTLIDANNLTYDGNDIVVSGCTLTINGEHQFNSLQVINNGIVTHSAATTGQPNYKLLLTISQDLTIATGSQISADGKGYGLSTGPGKGTEGYYTGTGGGYGGAGGSSSAVNGGTAYGSVSEPSDLGSGGGRATYYGYTGGEGGGKVRLTVNGTLQVDGSITANGVNGGGDPYYGNGAGSGGSIYITAGALAGAGVISANGGNGGGTSSGGGGGGRIAVYYLDGSSFSFSHVNANGGTGYRAGGAGTIHLVGPDATPIISVDTVSETLLWNPFNHIDVVFTRPINQSTFTTDDVFLLGPNGRFYATGITRINEIAGRETYRVSFPVQETNGKYQVTIGPDITGANGQPIGQVYEVTFWLDSIGPRITKHTPEGDIAGTVGHVDIWFSETIDTSTLTLSDINITGPGGSITPTSLNEIGINAFRISFSSQTAYGQYHVLVGPGVKDLAGNLMDQDQDGAQGEPDDAGDASFNIADVDLTMANVVVDAANLWAGELVNVSWDGYNYSGMPLLGAWSDAVYLSTDNHWDIDDKLMVTIPHSGGLLQNEVYSQAVTVLTPGVLPGNYYIIVRADCYNQEKEVGDDGNNIVAVGLIPLDVYDLLTFEKVKERACISRQYYV